MFYSKYRGQSIGRCINWFEEMGRGDYDRVVFGKEGVYADGECKLLIAKISYDEYEVPIFEFVEFSNQRDSYWNRRYQESRQEILNQEYQYHLRYFERQNNKFPNLLETFKNLPNEGITIVGNPGLFRRKFPELSNIQEYRLIEYYEVKGIGFVDMEGGCYLCSEYIIRRTPEANGFLKWLNERRE